MPLYQNKTTSAQTKLLHPAEQYAQDVLSGKIPAGILVRQAVQRHVDDLVHGYERGLWHDPKAAQRVIDYAHLLKPSQGEWAKKPLKLLPWQQFIIWNVFGWKRADGTRRFRIAYIEVPRKNGKSTLFSAVGLYLLHADGEPGAQIFSAATKLEQARVVLDEAMNMRDGSVGLAKHIGKSHKALFVNKTHSKFTALASEDKTLDGFNPHAGLLDEIHEHPNAGVWNVIKSGMGARRQPLLLAITTAGFDRNSVCYQQHDYVRKIVDPKSDVADDAYFGFIASVDNPEKWDDELEWAKANPSLGLTVKIDFLRDECRIAKEIVSEQNNFKRKYLDVWTQQNSRWMDIAKWDACAGESRKTRKPQEVFRLRERALRGRQAYVALDLGATRDLSALVFVFPARTPEEKFYTLAYFWIPEQGMEARVKRDRVPYDVWKAQGLIQVTPGNVTDYSFIRAKINELAALYDIREIAIDAWNATQLTTDLMLDGFNMVKHGQGFASMAAPTKELERLVLSQGLVHDGNPVLRWMMDNVVVETDAAGNMKPSKAKATEKIDGIVALIMALSRATAEESNNLANDVYSERGVTLI